jgi:hypothetical protein
MGQSMWHTSMIFCCFEQTFLVSFSSFYWCVTSIFHFNRHNFTYFLFLIPGYSILVIIQYYHINFNYFFVMEQKVKVALLSYFRFLLPCHAFCHSASIVRVYTGVEYGLNSHIEGCYLILRHSTDYILACTHASIIQYATGQ